VFFSHFPEQSASILSIMGAGASAVDGAKGADAAAIATGVQGLSAKDIAILSAALDANSGGDAIATNAKNIAQNEGDIHDLYLIVMTNKQGIFEARSMIEENRNNIMQNYSATFMGNRNMAVENTDAIYANQGNLGCAESQRPGSAKLPQLQIQ
jgi:hypothetical protein